MKMFYYLLSCWNCRIALEYQPEVIADVMVGPVQHQCSHCLNMMECEAFDAEEKRDTRAEEVRYHEAT